MGQQQLLLLLLGLVIVGIAVLVGLRAFEEGFRRGAADDILNRSIVLAQEAVQWRARSILLGGGEGSFIGLAEDPFGKLGFDAQTAHAEFSITEVTPTSLLITGVSRQHPDVGAWVRVTVNDVDSEVRFDGSIGLGD